MSMYQLTYIYELLAIKRTHTHLHTQAHTVNAQVKTQRQPEINCSPINANLKSQE